MRQADLAAAKHLFSSFSSPCFSVKIIYGYRLWSSSYSCHEKGHNRTEKEAVVLFGSTPSLPVAWVRKAQGSGNKREKR